MTDPNAMIVQLTVGELKAVLVEAVAEGLARARRLRDEPFITRPRAADLLDVHPSTIDSYVAEGMPAYELPGSLRFRASEVIQWRAEHFTFDASEIREMRAPQTRGVYVVAGIEGFVKIGFATNIARRIPGLQTGHPAPLRLLAVLGHHQRHERVFHRKYRAHRVTGEWFRLTPELATEIRKARARGDSEQ